jgi:probable rRNA maturation factor
MRRGASKRSSEAVSVEVINRQRRFDVDAARLARVAEDALAAVGRGDADLAVIISNDRRLRALNRSYRGKDRPTDVLSFPYEGDDLIGDVVVSADRASAQAAERGHSLQREVELLVLHGTLHVCGYDHETDDGTMDRLERRLRKKLLQ